MDPEQLNALAARLYERRHEAVVVPFRNCELSDWKPDEHECHRNSDYWVLRHPDHTAIRGWLVFDFTVMRVLGQRPFFRFNAHSVLEDGRGSLFDITPSRASQRYPFLSHNGSNDEFEELIEAHQLTVLNYFL